MSTQQWLDKIKAEPGASGVTLSLVAEVERLQAEQDEVKGRLSALIQVYELIQPFIGKKFVVAEIKAAVELAKGSPTIYQQKPEEWKEGRREE